MKRKCSTSAFQRAATEYNELEAHLFLRKHKMTVNDYRVFECCIQRYQTDGSAKTYNSKVAEVFRKFGFTAEKSDDGVNYDIKEH